MNLQVKNLRKQAFDHVILPFYSDEVDHQLIKLISGLETDTGFTGSFKEIKVLYHDAGTVYLLGLGKPGIAGKQPICFRSLAHNQGKNWQKGITLYLSHLSEASREAAGTGLGMATYQIGKFKSENETPAWLKKPFLLHTPEIDPSPVSRGLEIADTLNEIMALVDAPGNKKPPEELGNWAEKSGKKYGYKVKVLNKKALQKEGFHALLSVGQGSAFPPVLIEAEYRPKKHSAKIPTLALVGKGITFDTGGLSIKGSQNLHYMKSDMGGAAAVLGAVELAARFKLNIHLIGIVASAENAVDANSYRPGDVIGSYSGKTIEVIDTDAEGRLALADALAYAEKKYTPEYIIDLATLTGNAVMALGYAAGALFSNNPDLTALLCKAGDEVHERVWPMPLYDDFESELESDVADVRNFSGKPLAGAITAAKFLEYFVKEHPRWAHLDIAGVSFGDSEFSKMKSSSGFGPRLLLKVMEELQEES